jgi:tRNA-specific 2-thiouridylase
LYGIPKDAKIAVAMSGGVDSSVAAALLVEQGYQVFGMMLRLWSEPGQEAANRCCTPEAMAVAKRIAAQLKIPFYAIDAKDTFREIVVQTFIDGYAQGITPNPCLACNRHIRWEYLLNRALSLGADYMATGHYARLERTPSQPIRLLKGLDAHKDQSYVLSVLDQTQLQRALLPIGEYTKPQVREIAEKHKLPSARIKDSQDLCFLAGNDYHGFLQRYAPETHAPGEIITTSGEALGSHQGLAFYTIGQRKGLGIAHTEPLYVLAKNTQSNTLVVGTLEELGQDELSAGAANWVSGVPQKESFRADVKIRYTAGLVPASVTPIGNDNFKVKFDHPMRDITPGQAAVAYIEDEAIVSGIIEGEHTPTAPRKAIRLIE